MDNPKLMVFNRDSSALQVHLPVEPVVEALSWGEGGPLDGKATVIAADNQLWSLVELLRCPVEVWENAGKKWWGYIKGVQITLSNGLRVTVSLEKMSNKIRILYSMLEAGNEHTGEAIWSNWESDADSVAIYGTKELQMRMSEPSPPDQVRAYRARNLKEYKLPLSERDIGNVGSPATPQATLMLAGWWDTLGWLSYSENAGKESYETIGVGLQAFGDAAATTKVAQSIQLGSSRAWSAESIAVRVKKEGSPADNLTVELCADSAGAPGTVLASATLAGASVPENLNWETLTLSATVSLALSTTYWVVVRRSGANDASNYYKIDANESLGYSRGAFKIWNGSAWVARGTDADMLFQVLGVLETTQQIADMVTDCGQFLNGTQIEAASGVYSTPYRDGDQMGLTYIRELLKSGTSTNYRVRAIVKDDLKVWLDAEPAPGASDYMLYPDGRITDNLSGWVDAPPYQAWLNFSQLIPIGAGTGLIADPTRAFIEQATWTRGGKVNFRLRGMGLVIG